MNDLVELVDTSNPGVLSSDKLGAVERICQYVVEDVVNKRGLP